MERYCWVEGDKKECRFTAANSILKDLAKLTESVADSWNDLSSSVEMKEVVRALGIEGNEGETEAGFGRTFQLAQVLSNMPRLREEFSYDDIAEGVAARLREDESLSQGKRQRER